MAERQLGGRRWPEKKPLFLEDKKTEKLIFIARKLCQRYIVNIVGVRKHGKIRYEPPA